MHHGITQLVWHSKFKSACVNFPSHFTKHELLPFLNTPENQHPHFHNLLDIPPTHFSDLTYDNNSIDKSLNLPPPISPYSKQNPLPPSIDILLMSLYKLFHLPPMQ